MVLKYFAHTEIDRKSIFDVGLISPIKRIFTYICEPKSHTWGLMLINITHVHKTANN